jgi:hypothetical protein
MDRSQQSLLQQMLEHEQQNPQPEVPESSCYIRGWGAALFTMALGHMPIGAKAEGDQYVFEFPAAAHATKPRYYVAKDVLAGLQRSADRAKKVRS